MGNKAAKAALKPKDITDLQAGTRFSSDEIQSLFAYFVSLKATPPTKAAEATVDLAEFQRGVGFVGAPSLFVERVFAVMFDVDGTGLLSFKKFIDGMHRLSLNETLENRVRASFEMFNVSRNEAGISAEDLTRMLEASFADHAVEVNRKTIASLVEATFAEHDRDRDHFISLAEFRAMVAKNPAVLKPITLNISEMIASSTAADEAAEAASSGGGGAGGAGVAAGGR